jgi:hypothetical protein
MPGEPKRVQPSKDRDLRATDARLHRTTVVVRAKG